MEVSMLSAMGIPAEAMLSIRAGVTRRQAPAAPGKSLKFPNLEGGQLLKVDIMQKIGSSYIVLKPGSHAEAKYKLDFGDSMACELEVKQGDAAALPEPSKKLEEEPETKVTAMSVKDAKDYLDASGLLQFMQSVLQVVVKERPKDPFRFMARHFSSGYDVAEEEKEAPLVPQSDDEVKAFPPASPAEAVDEQPARETEAEAEKEEAAPPPDQPDEAPAAEEPEIVEILESKEEAAPAEAYPAEEKEEKEEKKDEQAETQAKAEATQPPPLPPTEAAPTPAPPVVPPLKLPQPLAPLGSVQVAPCLCGSQASCSKESVDMDTFASEAEVKAPPPPPVPEEEAEAELEVEAELEAKGAAPKEAEPLVASVAKPEASAAPAVVELSAWQASGYPLPAAVLPCHTVYGGMFGSMPVASGFLFI